MLFRRLTSNSEPRLSIESGPYSHQYVLQQPCSTTMCAQRCVAPCSYLIADNVVYLTIAEKSYPRKLAFSYLDELSKEFSTSYGPKVETVRKPYAFVGFGQSLQQTVYGVLIYWVAYRYVHVQDCQTVSGHACSRCRNWPRQAQ